MIEGNLRGSPRTALDLFYKASSHFGDNIAVQFGDQSISYSELNRQSDLLAKQILNLQGSSTAPVALMLEPAISVVTSMIACWKAQKAFLPIDLGQPRDRIEYMISDSLSQTLLTNRTWSDLDFFKGHICDVRELPHQPTDEDLSSFQLSSSDPAYIIYTSGTTGVPKGVVIEQKSIANYVHWFANEYQIGPRSVGMLLTSFAFDLGYTTLLTTVLTGGCLHLTPSSLLTDVRELLKYIRTHQISFIKLTPSILNAIVSSPQFTTDANCLESVRLLVTGGEAIRKGDVECIYKRYPEILIVNHYGPTETTIGVLTYPVPRSQLTELERKSILGRPIGGVTCVVADENLQPTAPGTPGELLVSGPCLARGYLNREELTLEKFVTCPFGGQERAYRTGDLVRQLEDGRFEFLGRIDRQVKVRGYRVELGEIEAQIRRAAQIETAVVNLIQRTEHHTQLCAYLVSDGPLNLSEIKKELQKTMPDYMVPTHFIQIGSLPTNANGKLDLNQLPVPDLIESPTRSLSFKNETERGLTSIWARLLGMAESSIGPDDHFIELGGDSLLAIHFIAEVQNRFQKKLSMFDLHERGTISEIAEILDSKGV